MNARRPAFCPPPSIQKNNRCPVCPSRPDRLAVATAGIPAPAPSVAVSTAPRARASWIGLAPAPCARTDPAQAWPRYPDRPRSPVAPAGRLSLLERVRLPLPSCLALLVGLNLVQAALAAWVPERQRRGEFQPDRVLQRVTHAVAHRCRPQAPVARRIQVDVGPWRDGYVRLQPSSFRGQIQTLGFQLLHLSAPVFP